ncbi:MAG: helix-turn-helix domain-containing protein [Bermanella sp.]
MEHNSENCRSNCPINFILETFGDKWTLLVVRDLMFKGKKYYGEFLESDEKISTNILAERLQRLETHGVITKEKDPDHKSKFIYALTEKGKALLPIMLEVTQWSSTYDALTNTPKEFSEALRVDKDGVKKGVLDRL